MTAAYVRFRGVFRAFCDTGAVGAGNGSGQYPVSYAGAIE